MRYRIKPMFVDAVQWVGDNTQEAVDFVIANNRTSRGLKSVQTEYNDDSPAALTTLTIFMQDGSTITAARGDWVVCGEDGQVRSLSSGIFSATYDRDVGPD